MGVSLADASHGNTEGEASLLHSNWLQTVTTTAPGKQATDLRLYLERLIEHLDDTSLRATLRLMIQEASAAVRRQEGLIALERLDGRDTARRLDRLRDLRRVRDDLTAAYPRSIDTEVTPTTKSEDNSGEAATEPLSRSFTRFPPVNQQEREAHVGRIPAARLHAKRPCSESPAVGHRQGRHGTRAAC